MQNGPKIAIGVTLVFLAAVGIRVGLIYHANHQQMDVPKSPYETSRTVTPDDNVYIRKEHPDSLADERTLIGKTLWVSAGDQMDFYRDPTGKHVDYAHPVGVLLGAQALLIKDVFEEKAPKTGRSVFRIAAGDRQVLLGFTMPNSSDPKTEYAVPVGNYAEGSYNFFTDDIFFYDDPHTLYSFWGPAVWSHIDKHEAALGMSENQAMMALGQTIVPHGDTVGDRSVTYDNDSHPVNIDFEHNKAVKVTPGT
jgi:hypothetical protein